MHLKGVPLAVLARVSRERGVEITQELVDSLALPVKEPRPKVEVPSTKLDALRARHDRLRVNHKALEVYVRALGARLDARLKRLEKEKK